MKKLLLTIAAVIPFATLAAAPTPPAGGPPPPANANAHLERIEKRMRVARALGLAEVLDLDEAQALKMQEAMAKFDSKRRPLWLAFYDSAQVIRRASNGDQVAQAQVDQAVVRIFDTRSQLQQLDREAFQAVTQGLPSQKRARAAVFLARFDGRFWMGMQTGIMLGRGMTDDGVGLSQWGGVRPMRRRGPMGGEPAADCPCGGGQNVPGARPPAQ